MNELLFERSTGNLGPNAFARLQTTQLLRSFRPAPHFRFDGGETGIAADHEDDEGEPAVSLWAHQAGVNALALDRFDGRILVSGGSDATIRIWDLEQSPSPHEAHAYRPVAQIARGEAQPLSSSGPNSSRRQAAAPAAPATPGAHRFGITHLSFYPFDSAAFLSSSYDTTLKLWSTRTAQLSGSFALGSKVYTHAVSSVASHLLVACGTQHPAVRLVDLRSGAAVQSLVAPGQVGGSAGAVLAVAWSPRHEHVLASGTTDGAVRIWDVRRASGLVGLLDQEDSLGIGVRAQRTDGSSAGATAFAELQQRGIRMSARAHTGAVNGLTWTDDGEFIVSAGHDQRIRVWDAATGANTLASFGPTIRNRAVGTVHGMFVTPVGLTPPRSELLVWPNENEILVLDLHRGSVVTRLRGTGPTVAAVRARGGAAGGERTVRNRVTSLVWRGAGGGGGSSGVVMGGTGAAGGIYSGHLDGQIRAWMPAVEGDDEEDEDNSAQEVVEQKTRKRKAIDDAFRSLMGRQITFT
ncbi:WD40 repeat-like protein [Coniochaeta ligniaria NRRL 30616]|uniref:WD40 repeat-like protein n=1 Tax=Coniochaeta ligniaria NRRL 30616 TaxID=1408157 RepID=A0A1J7IMS6_9PEZI|nr:WD40 repeat-like protein [Coniochaeta ligniaria NRRL 30616]